MGTCKIIEWCDNPKCATDGCLARKAVEAEREACAMVCESMGAMEAIEGEEEGSAAMVRVADRQSDLCAKAIRERSNLTGGAQDVPKANAGLDFAKGDMRKIWIENTKHLFLEGAGCACPGLCADLGYCPVTGDLKALTYNEARDLAEKAKQEVLESGEVAEALKWWRAIKLHVRFVVVKPNGKTPLGTKKQKAETTAADVWSAWAVMCRCLAVLAPLFIVLPWLAGTVLAKGFWLTTAAIFFPPYAWYLVVERVLMAIGWAGI